jgi:hypothetical protein
VVSVVVLLACGGGRASAQTAADPDRIRISVNGGGQFSSVAFDTVATRLVYLENATSDASYTLTRGLAADAGVSVRVAGRFRVGVSVSEEMETRDANVTAAIPHPFFFRTPRTVTGTASDLRRDELVAHLQGIYAIRPSSRVDVAISAGPSFFRVQQDVVTDVSFSDVYPYDTATFTSAAAQRVSATKIGFNAGVDIGLRLSRHAGVGAEVRFSRASLSLTVPNSTAAVPVDAGGIQLVGGLRLFF